MFHQAVDDPSVVDWQIVWQWLGICHIVNVWVFAHQLHHKQQKQLSLLLYHTGTLLFRFGRLNVSQLHQYVYHITVNNALYSDTLNEDQSHSKNHKGIEFQENILISQITSAPPSRKWVLGSVIHNLFYCSHIQQ